MCVIIVKKAGVKRLDPKYFNEAWEHNPDGGGLVWKKPGEDVFIQKGFMDKQSFLKKIDELNQDDTAFIAHFRIKSVGQVCAENTHPFNMDYVTYAHNGTLKIEPLDGKTDSETFGLAFLKDKTMDWIKEYKVLLEMALGTSKFAIMDNTTGEILILNEELGQKRDDAWFSNGSAFPVAPVPARSNYNYYNNHYNSLFNDNIKSKKDFGTKRYSMEYAHTNNDNIWVYNSNNNSTYVYGYKKAAIHKRGFQIINPSYSIPTTGKNKTYVRGAPELRIVDRMTKEVYSGVKEYQKTTFTSKLDRDEAEADLSAEYTVIRVMRMFIQEGKAIDNNEFYEFLLENTKPDSWVGSMSPESAWHDYVVMYAQDVLNQLERGGAKA